MVFELIWKYWLGSIEIDSICFWFWNWFYWFFLVVFFDVLIDSAFDFMVDFFMADQLWPLKFWLKRLLSFATWKGLYNSILVLGKAYPKGLEKFPVLGILEKNSFWLWERPWAVEEVVQGILPNLLWMLMYYSASFQAMRNLWQT